MKKESLEFGLLLLTFDFGTLWSGATVFIFNVVGLEKV